MTLPASNVINIGGCAPTDKSAGERREIKREIVIRRGVRLDRRSSRVVSGGAVMAGGLPTATGTGLLRGNVRVLIPILIARRKDDARVQL